MDPASKLTDLIEDIYDAALEPTRWHDVVAGINDFVGSKACGLISRNNASQHGRTHYYYGVDPHYVRIYSEYYCRFDPLTTLPPFGPVVGISDLLPCGTCRSGPFYQQWLRPQGRIDVANVVLDKVGQHSADLLTFLPGAGTADTEMRQRISTIVPHARRALLINKTISARQSQVAAFADTLNGLSSAIFLLDASCRIVHANTAGENLLDMGDVLRSINGQLVARDVQAGRALRDAFADGRAPAADRRCVALPMAARDGEHYIAHLLPLTALTRATVGRSVAALFVRRAELDSPSGDVIASTFELTPAELRVMLSIANVGGVAETAAALGVAESTVKTHLRHVFSKTGTSRQAELIKLIAAHASPLRRA
jgi:DNA-binding CsgD family transcriptional regulator